LAKNVFFFFFFLTGAQAEDLSHCYRKEATQQMTSFLPAHGSSSSTTFLHFMSHITSSSGRCMYLPTHRLDLFNLMSEPDLAPIKCGKFSLVGVLFDYELGFFF